MARYRDAKQAWRTPEAFRLPLRQQRNERLSIAVNGSRIVVDAERRFCLRSDTITSDADLCNTGWHTTAIAAAPHLKKRRCTCTGLSDYTLAMYPHFRAHCRVGRRPGARRQLARNARLSDDLVRSGGWPRPHTAKLILRLCPARVAFRDAGASERHAGWVDPRSLGS